MQLCLSGIRKSSKIFLDGRRTTTLGFERSLDPFHASRDKLTGISIDAKSENLSANLPMGVDACLPKVFFRYFLELYILQRIEPKFSSKQYEKGDVL